MCQDGEINALNNIYEILKGLNNAQIKRILDWVKDKFELDKHPDLKAVERETEPEAKQEPAPTTPIEVVEAAVEPLKEIPGHRQATTKPIVEMPMSTPTAAAKITGFIKYDNFEELLLFSNVNTNTAKILLAAAFLQDKKNLKEFGSYDISILFKKIGEEVSQPSSAINNLMSKKPPLLLQTGTQGTGLKSRRKFRVTEEGLRIASNYIKK
jgi:hypothetical protein